MIRSSKPFPLLAGPITLTDHGFLGPLARGRLPLDVGVSAVPQYMALLFHARLCRMLGPHAGQLPTIEQFESVGGFSPMSFLDVMAGGIGDGQRWTWIEYRAHSLLDFELLASPAYEDPVVVSTKPFPVLGSRVDDGTGVEPGFIPEWMAALLHRRESRFNGRPGMPLLGGATARGAFSPVEVLDLMIGGRGDGLAHRMVEKKWLEAKALTELERGILQDATPVLQINQPVA